MTYINALIDSGASVNFIDLALASKYPSLHCLLQIPLDLEFFDGKLTSGGSITHDLTTPILYPNGVQHMVTFHETKLNHSTPIVLGLKWLRDINPNMDWTSLSLVFQKERLTGAIPMLRPGKDYKTLSQTKTILCTHCEKDPCSQITMELIQLQQNLLRFHQNLH